MPDSFRSGKRQFTRLEWSLLKKLYKNRCVRCSLREDAEHPLTADHVIPIFMGGSKGIGNIQPLCKPCNLWKSNRIQHGEKILDWRERKFKT